jgi:hypothetical protein
VSGCRLRPKRFIDYGIDAEKLCASYRAVISHEEKRSHASPKSEPHAFQKGVSPGTAAGIFQQCGNIGLSGAPALTSPQICPGNAPAR